MNGLGICQGEQIGHADNPGITVSLFVAFYLKCYQTITFSGKPVAELVFADPDAHIANLRILFDLFNFLLLFLIGWMIILKTRSVGLTLLFQLGPYLSVNLLEHVWTKVSPEPMLFLVCLLFSGFWIRYYLAGYKIKNSDLVFLGLMSGLGLATKSTFVPLILFPYFFIPGIRGKLKYTVYFSLTFLVFLIPARNAVSDMIDWYAALLTHTGIYGSGSSGFIEPGSYLKNLWEIAWINPVLIGVFVGSVIMIIYISTSRYKKNQEFHKPVRFLIAISTVFFISVLMVAKHYQGYHWNHYLLPVLSLTGFALFVIADVVKKLVLPERFRDTLPVTMFATLSAIGVVFFLPVILIKDAAYEDTNWQLEDTQRIIDRDYPDYYKIYFFPLGHNPFVGYKFGNETSLYASNEALRLHFPDVAFFDSRLNNLTEWLWPLSMEYLINTHGEKILFSGFPPRNGELEILAQAGYPPKQVNYGGTQALYVLDTAASAYKNRAGQDWKAFELSCDMEILSDNRRFFMADQEQFGGGELQSTDRSRSGAHSLKMGPETIYAFDYRVHELRGGSAIYSRIWRYPRIRKRMLYFQLTTPIFFIS